MKNTNQECIFGCTPRPKDEIKEQKEPECIFKKQDIKDNNPIKITKSLFQSQIAHKEDIKKIQNNFNNNNIREIKNEKNILLNNNDINDNNINSIQCKTQFKKKKKMNFLKTSINLNMMDVNVPSFNSNNENDKNIDINFDNNIIINKDNNNILNKNNINNININNNNIKKEYNKDNNIILNNNIDNNNINNINISNENNIENKNIEINNNIKIQNNIENKNIENIIDDNNYNEINATNNINNKNINLILPKNKMNNEIDDNINKNINKNINNNNYNNNINKNMINNNNNKNININSKTSNNIIHNLNNNNLDKMDKEENERNKNNIILRKNSNGSKEINDNKKEVIIKRHKYSEEEIKKKKLEEELSRDQVKDHLKCYICYNKIEKPRMCRNCNKLACEECLKNWFSNKKQCAFCRSKMRFEDTIYVPIMEEISTYFINEAEKEPIINDSCNTCIISRNEEMNSYDNNEKGNENKCKEHNALYEYHCVQCNQNYCSNCLLFFNKSARIHENHFILPISQLESMEIKETIDEFRKLDISKKNIEDLIKLCNLKIKEMEIEKSQNLNILDMIKKNINDKLDTHKKAYTNQYNSLKSKDDEITRAFETTPIALQNIVNSKDHGQGEKIYEHIKSINKGYVRNYDTNTNKLKNNFIESFTTEQFEFTLPNEGTFTEYMDIFNKQLNNFIPDNQIQILLKYIKNYMCFTIVIKNVNNNYHQDKVRYYGFIIIQNKKYECEFVVTEDKVNFDKHILTVKISSNHFISFKDEIIK